MPNLQGLKRENCQIWLVVFIDRLRCKFPPDFSLQTGVEEIFQVRVDDLIGADFGSFDIILVVNLYLASLLCIVANFIGFNLFVAQSFDGIEFGGFHCRICPKNDPD